MSRCRAEFRPSTQTYTGASKLWPVISFGCGEPEQKEKRWCDIGQDAVFADAVEYAKFFSRSHDAVIRVCNDAGNVIETHEHT